ncbi:MAG: hypothetical protein H0T79_15465 [Deltaproteobacteria bacterium]|nr:hypothetical protein [Deltaproteobacteria bacterium]
MASSRASPRAPADAKEERALIAAHGARWIGELAALVEHDSMRFEDGFLAWCAIDSDRLGVVEQLTGNVGWSTVQHIYLAGNAFPHGLLVDPIMKSLASVTGIRSAVAERVLAGPATYPWKRVGIDPPDAGRAELPAQLRRTFPEATALHLHAARRTISDFAFLWSDAFAQLTTIGFVSLAVSAIPAFLDVALARVAPTTTIEFSEYHHLGYMVRVAGPMLELRSRAAWGRRATRYGDLVRALQPYAGTFTRIRLHDRATKVERAEIETLLAPGGELVS